MSPSGYITAPRLVPRGQHLQGDIFEAVPFLVPTAHGSAEIEKLLAILLTPTCDFAVKTGGDLRQVYAIEVLTLDSPLRQQFAKDVVPHHVFPLPLLDPFLPHGGAVHLRRVSPVHAEQLETSTRVATLNESGCARCS
ncbi:MAG: hypothetical protein M1396_00630 [Chloroflexi bacterium]|nr:hypothetical protein [Chloroflexota bacterium]